MDRRLLCWLLTFGLIIVPYVSAATAQERNWTDKRGEFIVGVRGDDSVVLRGRDGKEFTVAFERLSNADLSFVESQAANGAAHKSTNRKRSDKSTATNETEPPRVAIANVAKQFYADLRTEEREVARQSLTKKASLLIKDGKSPFSALPQPEEGDKSIKVGKPKLDGKVAEIPVFVRAGADSWHKIAPTLRRRTLAGLCTQRRVPRWRKIDQL
jgi:hypothetical protein